MAIGLLTVAIELPGARSLKEKRSRVKPILARLQREFNLSCAELADQDLHDRAGLGMVVIAADGKVCTAVLEQVLRFLESRFPEEPVLEHHINLV